MADPGFIQLRGPGGPPPLPNQPHFHPHPHSQPLPHGPQLLPRQQRFPQQPFPVPPPEPPPEGVPLDLRLGHSFNLHDICDVSEDCLSEADMRAQCTDYVAFRFDKIPGHARYTDEGEPIHAGWEKARRTHIKGLSKQDIVREVRRLNRDTVDIMEKRQTMGPPLQKQLDKTIHDLIEQHRGDGANYEWTLAQADHQLREIGKHLAMTRDRGPMPKTQSKTHRRTSSSSSKRSSRKKYWERVSLTAYFKRAPRPDADIPRLYKERRGALETTQGGLLSRLVQGPPGHMPPSPPPPPLSLQPPLVAQAQGQQRGIPPQLPPPPPPNHGNKVAQAGGGQGGKGDKGGPGRAGPPIHGQPPFIMDKNKNGAGGGKKAGPVVLPPGIIKAKGKSSRSASSSSDSSDSDDSCFSAGTKTTTTDSSSRSSKQSEGHGRSRSHSRHQSKSRSHSRGNKRFYPQRQHVIHEMPHVIGAVHPQMVPALPPPPPPQLPAHLSPHPPHHLIQQASAGDVERMEMIREKAYLEGRDDERAYQIDELTFHRRPRLAPRIIQEPPLPRVRTIAAREVGRLRPTSPRSIDSDLSYFDRLSLDEDYPHERPIRLNHVPHHRHLDNARRYEYSDDDDSLASDLPYREAGRRASRYIRRHGAPIIEDGQDDLMNAPGPFAPRLRRASTMRYNSRGRYRYPL